MTNFIKYLCCLVFLLLPFKASAQSYRFGTTPALHVEGNKLKDPNGGTVTLHGVMDTPSPYFNSYRWGQWWGGFTDEAVTRCRDYFDQITTAITQPSRGTYCNLFRLHLDPCWTNTGNTTGEDDISKFSADRLRTYLNSLYIPIAVNAVSKGLYVIIRPPGVFPQEVNVGGEYNNYLMTVWDIVSNNATLKQYSGQISLELGNEPVRVKNRYGQDDAAALHDFFQPIVNKIRQNGFNGILWIPGTGWQSNYRDYVSHPISDSRNNYGYAVHDYVGWYNGDNSDYADWRLNNYINQFHTQVPVIDNYPIVITEVDWSPENSSSGHTDEHGNWVNGNFGTWATGTTSNWGRLYKGLLDRYPENISMTLSGTDCYLDVEAYLNNGTIRPAFTTAMQQKGFADAWEACSGACFQWYKQWGEAQMNGGGGGIASFTPDQKTGRYYVNFNDLSVSGNLSFDRNSGVLSLPAGQSGKLTLTFNGANFSNVSLIKMSSTGDDIFNSLMIKNSANNSVNTDGGAFYTSKYLLNYTKYQGNSASVATLEWEGTNNGSATKTMTLQQILIQVDVMWATQKHEKPLAQSEFGVWNDITANAVRTGDDSDMQLNLNEFIAGYGTIYGNGSVLSHNYADLTKYSKLRVYGDNGLLVRALFNRTSDEETSGNGGLQPYIEYTNPAQLAGKTFAIVRGGNALYGTEAQNLDFNSYANAFSGANSGYLFKAESITVNGGSYYLLRLITPAGEEYSVYGGPGYLNAQPLETGWCCFILGLNNQNGQDFENGAVWDIKYVDGQGMTIKNVGTGRYLTNAGPANSETPVYWTLCTLKEQTNTNLIEKAGEITDGVFEVDLKSLGEFAHLNALKVGGGSGSAWRVMVVDDTQVMDYSIAGKVYVEDNLKAALNDISATNYDATALTNTAAVALNTANKNALIYVNNASKLSNSANVVVKNGDSYSASNIVLTDGVADAQGQRAYAALGGSTTENATWTESNGNYIFEWASGASGQWVEIMHWVYITEQNHGRQYKYLLVDTEEFTSKWGVQFLDGDGNVLAKQEYWASMEQGGTKKILNIDALFAAAGNTSKRSNLTKIRLYNFDANSGGKVVVKQAYLYNEPTENVYPFFAPYDIAAASAKLTTSIPEEGFTTLTTPFAASMPTGFTSYALLEDNVLTFDRIDPNAPMVVKGSGNLELTATNTTVKATDGLVAGVLKGVYSPTVVAAGNYVQKEATRADSFSPTEGVTLYVVTEGAEPTIYPFHAYATKEVVLNNNDEPDPVEYEPYELTVSGAGVATLYLPFDAIIPDADFIAAAAVKSMSDNTAYLREVKRGIIPANTGVMIFANPGKYTFVPSEVPATENVQSILHGVLVDTPVNTLREQEGGANIYVLSRGIEEYTGFKIVGSTVKSIPAFRAYLTLPADSEIKEINVSFGGQVPTGIDDVKAILEDANSNNTGIYDLSGRRVNNPTKGIYIINGKKVIIK